MAFEEAIGPVRTSSTCLTPRAEKLAEKILSHLEKLHSPPVVEGKCTSPFLASETKLGAEQCEIRSATVGDGVVASTNLEVLEGHVPTKSVVGSKPKESIVFVVIR